MTRTTSRQNADRARRAMLHGSYPINNDGIMALISDLIHLHGVTGFDDIVAAAKLLYCTERAIEDKTCAGCDQPESRCQCWDDSPDQT